MEIVANIQVMWRFPCEQQWITGQSVLRDEDAVQKNNALGHLQLIERELGSDP